MLHFGTEAALNLIIRVAVTRGNLDHMAKQIDREQTINAPVASS